MTEDKSFAKFVFICQIIGVLIFLVGIYIYINGLPMLSSTRDKHAKFCYEQGGHYIEPVKWEGDVCIFSYNNYWSAYAMEEVVNEFPDSQLKKGDLCFVCYDSGSCARDTLTALDNGTRRATRC